jgi:hypothetical protein
LGTFITTAKKQNDFIRNLSVINSNPWAIILKTAVADGKECQDFDSQALTQGIDIPKW